MILTKRAPMLKSLKYYPHGMNNDAWKRYSSAGYNHYKVIAPGFKYNMTDMQAVIGIEQLKKLKRIGKRGNLYGILNEEFSTTNLKLTLKKSDGNRMAYHLFDTT